ncbi:Hypothetical protein NCS54_01315100 [Fusarium falciforme]|uniref:Hypothetical protein n=1 Tax=Fusarium falciforme TaxID=195108 RepID=UPI00230066B2|nr:Hypothetical protein NCS54_01315100 [Fusarium falciforme]WAO95525.1 Hypothetical protein NCS54_01315100 [Fusarium falciforme]
MTTFPTINGTEVFRLPPPDYGPLNFDNPKQQKKLEHYLIFGLGAPLALIALLQRYYTKIFLSKGLQIDDGFMFLGWVTLLDIHDARQILFLTLDSCSVLTQALLIASIAQGGMCAHSWEMSLADFQRYSLISYLCGPIYQLCNGFIKLSLLSFYLHLSPQRWFRIAFLCIPPRKAFDFKVEGGSCTDGAILYMATAVSNIVTDVILFVLPIPMVYNLHMPKIQKFGAIIVFAIGSLTVATSVNRLVYLPVVLASTDVSWDSAPANIWIFIEANLFVICGSMPTLRKLFKHFMPRIVGSSGASHYGATSYGQHQQSNTLSPVRKGRSQYAQFPEDNATELERFSDDDNKNGGTVVVGNASTEGLRDDHSDRAILQTQAFTVQYSP